MFVLLLLALTALAGCTTDDPSEARDGDGRATPSVTPTTEAGSTTDTGGGLADGALLSALRAGGLVIYFRHTATDSSPDDSDPFDFSNRSTQRQLSKEGRAQARAIGEAIRELDIPIGQVRASPFFRTVDTAQLAFGKATTEFGLENLETAADQNERDMRTQTLRRLLAGVPDEGTNTVLVAHGFNITAAAQVTLAEGEAAVFQPDRDSGFRLVATIAADEWARLGSAAGGKAGVREYAVPAGDRPHDVAPAPDGTVWYTAQGSGVLGSLDPRTGDVERIPLGEGARPHGVIVGPDGAAWVTDSGLNAILRVDQVTHEVTRFPLPGDENVNLNTATFDGRGILWFTGQSGYYGSVDPADGRVRVFEAPGGRGPYGIATTPGGDVYYASLAGSHLARIDVQTGRASVLEPPTEAQGARRVWSDSRGRLWISEWNAGQLGMYDPAAEAWQEWKLPGDSPQPYAVYVDEADIVWISDFGSNALVRFDPDTEAFRVFPLPSDPGDVRQILGRTGEVWGAESAADALVAVPSG